MVSAATPRPYRFGDLLALSRKSWVDQLARATTSAGFPGYRRADAVLLRMLRRGPCPLGRLTEPLGVTRQGARKTVSSLQERGHVALSPDPQDRRRTVAELTERGRRYADVVEAAARAIELRVRAEVTEAELATADLVLRAVVPVGDRGQLERLVPPVPGFLGVPGGAL